MAVNCRVLKGGSCEITQYYGGSNNHLGIDIVGKNYTIDTVLAHTEGTVEYVQTGQYNNQGSTGNISYGNYVKINHGNGNFTLYAHLDTVNVKIGDKVVKGTELGRMGNTGNSYGAHLHFEVFKNNTRVDPYTYLDQDLVSSVTNAVERNENNDQLKVTVNDLRVRTSASTTSNILGFALENGIYNFYETKENEGYTWYKIADNQWLANTSNWCVIYPKKTNEVEELKKEIETLKQQIAALEKENKNYKIFIPSSSGLYYIELNDNEKLIYKKSQ